MDGCYQTYYLPASQSINTVAYTGTRKYHMGMTMFKRCAEKLPGFISVATSSRKHMFALSSIFAALDYRMDMSSITGHCRLRANGD